MALRNVRNMAYMHLGQLQNIGPILGIVCREYMSAARLNNYPEHLEPIYLIPTTPVSVNSELSTKKSPKCIYAFRTITDPRSNSRSSL
jgi:hypothetical protein